MTTLNTSQSPPRIHIAPPTHERSDLRWWVIGAVFAALTLVIYHAYSQIAATGSLGQAAILSAGVVLGLLSLRSFSLDSEFKTLPWLLRISLSGGYCYGLFGYMAILEMMLAGGGL